METARPDAVPVILAWATRDKARDLLRRAFTRRRSHLSIVSTAEAARRVLTTTLVDAVIVDLAGNSDEAWTVVALARELPSLPFFALAPLRVADASTLGRCAALDVTDMLFESVDEAALRELVMPHTFTERFVAALHGAERVLGLDAPLQRRSWDLVVSAGGRPVRTDAVAQSLGVTREHLSRSFASEGAPNLKRVIDLVRLIAAAELAKNPGYDVGDVAKVLGFASPSHLTSTAERVAGIRVASLTLLRARDLIARFVQGRSRSRR
ncbi:MAG: helix-turn-helix domain-containing protein [Gemmatimonadota bacterium]|nr:helix-turn-helix domain-containing protein [Gemmatimonadota bacterium]